MEILFFIIAIKLLHHFFIYWLNKKEYLLFYSPNSFVINVELFRQKRGLSNAIIYVLTIIFSLELHIYLLFINKYNFYRLPKLRQLLLLITNPFCHPKFECSPYACEPSLHRLRLWDEKTYWNYIFKKHNVSTPGIYAVTDGGIILGNIPHGIDLIIKPNYSSFGNSIKLFDGITPTTGKYIIQERIKSKNENGHYRIDTFCRNGKVDVFLMYYMFNDGKKIATNEKQGATVIRVSPENIKDNHLLSAIEKCKELHQKELPQFYFIGFDVMITSDNYFFIEGNVFAGVALESDKNYFAEYLNLKNALRS